MQMTMVPIGGGEFGDNMKLMAAIYATVRDESAEGQRFMQIYPPKSSSTTYRRTGTLRRSWSNEVKKGLSNITGIIGSNAKIAPYNEKVQGEDQQELFDQIGWSNVNDLADKINRELPGNVQNAIDKAFGGL